MAQNFQIPNIFSWVTERRNGPQRLREENDPANDPPADDPDDNTALLNPYVRWYFFIAGQWFAPVENIIEAWNLPRKVCRIAYAVWQALVVIVMWSFFLYSMGFLTIRTLQEVDWLCPLTDIKNMVHGLCWIVNQHTGVIFFSFGNLENLLRHLSITKQELKRRASSSSIVLFLAGSVAWLFVVPISLHATQMMIPDFITVPSYRDGKIYAKKNYTFPPAQVALDVVFYTASRYFSLPIFFAFLHMLVFLCCEVEKFKEELETRQYPKEDQARKKAKQIRNLIKDTEKAFRFFLALYIAMLLLASSLEIFSIVEKAETVITRNHTVYFIPASATATSLQTLDLGTQNITAIPHRLIGKRSIPYMMVVLPPGNHTDVGMGNNYAGVTKIVVDQFKLKTQEIVVTAVLDITENVVLYALPLYQMSTLKSSLQSVVEMVEDSDYGEQNSNEKIFDTRIDKKDFLKFFRRTCTSGVQVLGRKVSFLWTLVLTFFGPFVVVVVNLMFKHIHVESPWH